MKVKYKTREIIDMYKALDEFSKKDIEMPSVLAWNIYDNIIALKQVFDKFIVFRDSAFEELNSLNAFENPDKNGFMKVKKEFEGELKSVNARLEEYLEIENEIEIIKVDRDELPKVLTLKDIKALRFMINN